MKEITIKLYTFEELSEKAQERALNDWNEHNDDPFMWREEDGSDGDTEARDYKQFEETYNAICDEMERIGYDHIEYITSREAFIETCEANEYTFEENGRMRNIPEGVIEA